MGITREMLDELRRLVRPLATRVANTVARGVVQRVDDGTKQQRVQLGVLAGETVDDGEHFQPYGFSSVPLGGEAVVLFPNGDRAHPLVVVISDRQYRPSGGEPGEVTVYNHTGAKIRMTKDGDIEVRPAPGRQVKAYDAGAAVPLATKADIDALKTWASTHVHTGVTAGAAASGLPGVAPPAAAGTSVLKAE